MTTDTPMTTTAPKLNKDGFEIGKPVSEKDYRKKINELRKKENQAKAKK